MEGHELALGNLVQDRVTGIKGIATAKTEFLNGCIQVELTPKLNPKEPFNPEKVFGISFDIQQLKRIGAGLNIKKKETKKTKKTGGPSRVLQRRAY